MRWQSSTSTLEVKPSDNLTHWLTKPYILSKALKRVCTKLSLSLISEQTEQPLTDEIALLEKSLDENVETAFVRKILLVCDGNPVIFARTVIPNPTYAQFKEKLETLGGGFIGESLLYGHDDIIRHPFEFGYFNQEHPMLIEANAHVATLDAEQLWARRSTFTLPQNPLLITECFLPPLEQILFIDE